MTLPLFDHQAETLEFGKQTDIVFDTSDPGTGKTRSHLELILHRKQHNGLRKTLIIAPKSLLSAAWGEDIKKFAPTLTYSIAYAKNRAKAFTHNVDVYITNTDAVSWLVRQPASFWDGFEFLIVDESTTFKNPKAKRTKAMQTIARKFRWRSCLTGTPNPNSIVDVHQQVQILDGGQRLGPSYYQFRNTVCVPTQVGNSPHAIKWENKPGVEVGIAGLIEDITIRHKLEECIDMPQHIMTQRKVQLSPKLMKQYKQLAKTAIVQIKDQYITGVNAAALTNKLLQACAGTVYDEEGEPIELDDGRIQLAVDLAREVDHSVMFFQWRHQRDRLIESFNKENISYCLIDGSTSDKERESSVRRYQSGLHKVFLAHPQAAGHGLTLTRGTRTIWVSPTWNLETFIQANRRIYRAGQKKRTETIVLTAENTVEEQVFQRLTEKDAVQTSVLDLMEMLSA